MWLSLSIGQFVSEAKLVLLSLLSCWNWRVPSFGKTWRKQWHSTVEQLVSNAYRAVTLPVFGTLVYWHVSSKTSAVFEFVLGLLGIGSPAKKDGAKTTSITVDCMTRKRGCNWREGQINSGITLSKVGGIPNLMRKERWSCFSFPKMWGTYCNATCTSHELLVHQLFTLWTLPYVYRKMLECKPASTRVTGKTVTSLRQQCTVL